MRLMAGSFWPNDPLCERVGPGGGQRWRLDPSVMRLHTLEKLTIRVTDALCTTPLPKQRCTTWRITLQHSHSTGSSLLLVSSATAEPTINHQLQLQILQLLHSSLKRTGKELIPGLATSFPTSPAPAQPTTNCRCKPNAPQRNPTLPTAPLMLQASLTARHSTATCLQVKLGRQVTLNVLMLTANTPAPSWCEVSARNSNSRLASEHSQQAPLAWSVQTQPPLAVRHHPATATATLQAEHSQQVTLDVVCQTSVTNCSRASARHPATATAALQAKHSKQVTLHMVIIHHRH